MAPGFDREQDWNDAVRVGTFACKQSKADANSANGVFEQRQDISKSARSITALKICRSPCITVECMVKEWVIIRP